MEQYSYSMLDIYGIKINSYNFSGLTKLEELILEYNPNILDLKDCVNLKKLTILKNINSLILNDNCNIKELHILAINWNSLRFMKQFKNLEFLHFDVKKDENDKSIHINMDFTIQINLIKIEFNHIYSYSSQYENISYIDNYNFSGLVKLQELNLDSIPINLNLKDNINLKKLILGNQDESNIEIINQPNIEILILSGMFENLNINNLINLKELECYNIIIQELNLINQNKLNKLKYIGYNKIINVNNNKESKDSHPKLSREFRYLEIEGIEEHGEDVEIISSNEIKNMKKLKYLKLDGFLIEELPSLKTWILGFL